MTTHHIASWLMEHSSVPKTVLKPVATKLGVSTNYVGAALFAGQIVYENQDTVVTYTGKGSVTVGQFLHEQSRRRYGDDHPLTEYLGENVDAVTEAFEGTEEEARSFAEFYRRFRAVDRDYRLRDGIDVGVPESVTDRMPDADSIPSLGGNADETDPSDAVDIPVTDPES
ncbi:hypothetical protein [Halorussus sp. MSC15.2]|uniref:hypothetical protein n=1 Tax=Halorussus sp. MSC15.2 TaxID=2283638 RepID=UPI0013D538FD|nr:hypothetical protein [Halorussus sp. MSC15.2]NEU57131.1 hypothetical protein [Halorussus sp. MSC15.2]